MKKASRYLVAITALTAGIASAAEPVKAAPAKPAVAKPATKAAAAKPAAPVLGPPKVASKPGLWETKTATMMDNGGSREGTSQLCVSPHDLRTPEVLLPTYSQVGMTCANRDVQFNGNVATWKVSCVGASGAIEGGGKLTFAATTQTGSGKFEQGLAGKTIKMQQTINARFVGPC